MMTVFILGIKTLCGMRPKAWSKDHTGDQPAQDGGHFSLVMGFPAAKAITRTAIHCSTLSNISILSFRNSI